jgi:L-cysteine:1D-myo-inositol 2-amino-2-deoxy-alpha-D-glucopyranoside ligase
MPQLHDTASGGLRDAAPTDGTASLYVCGITPYDATHLGHANTYLAFDTLHRLWLDAGVTVRYTLNTTDVDDPLLERAAATGVDWRELAAAQTELFREDMAALRVLPPTDFVAVTDVVADVAAAVGRLVADGVGYTVDDDVYFDVQAANASGPWHLGDVSGYDHDTMLALSAERGGDPDRPGKRDGVDPLLWRAERPGEPAWDGAVGRGRPGWHVECSVIAASTLDLPVTVKGGGNDLVFPHHELSAAHTAALEGQSLASLYAHAGMVGFRGEKMSKSLGNLVFVSVLRGEGVDPRGIRLALLAHHYRNDWEYTDAELGAALDRLQAWTAWAAQATDAADGGLAAELRAALAADLDTPAALAAVDARVASGRAATRTDLAAIDALLGVEL